MTIRITEADFIKMFRLEQSGVPAVVRDLFNEYDLTYREANKEDWNEYTRMFRELDERKDVLRSAEENLLAFERGWSENLEDLHKASPADYEAALKPRYFRGSRFFRFDNKLVVTENLQLEYELFVIARFCLFYRYLAGSERIYELGSGSCANLLLLSRAMPDASLVGLDWTNASCGIAEELARKLSRPISGRRFNMLTPDRSYTIPEGSAILSIHAFEQLGASFEPILDYMLRSRPSIVVQYEPVLDFYDERTLFDSLALAYCKKRGYLQGYYARLHQLESQGRIKFIAAYRPYLGGVLHEQSVLAWRPV